MGSNQTAIQLYQSCGYHTEYSYRQKEVRTENLPPLQGKLHFRPYTAGQDGEFSRKLLFEQYQRRASANASLTLTAGEISAGFTHCLEIYNFENQKKELILAEHADGSPLGLLWFYNSKGDLGKRRYIWMHSALSLNPDDLPQLLAYLEQWAVDHQLDAIRTPVHQCETGLISALDTLGYQPSNIFMIKKI